MMRSTLLVALAGLDLMAVTCGPLRAEPGVLVNERQMQRALRLAFPSRADQWETRLVPDHTMATCAAWKNQPPKDVAEGLRHREAKQIKRPADGQYMGDWRRGEKIAQSGYGMRFTDTDASRANGGNCYACHELSPDEVSFGTLGVSLKGIGRTHKFDPAFARLIYEKIYNSQSAVACSLMPRFGANGILSIEQIKDLVAYLMDPKSPVNREPTSKLAPGEDQRKTERQGASGGPRK